MLARELTKRFEEFLRGTLEEAIEWVKSNQIRGEFCLYLRGATGRKKREQEPVWWQGLSVDEHVAELMEQKGIRSKEAIREVAITREMSRRDVYQAYHVEH